MAAHLNELRDEFSDVAMNHHFHLLIAVDFPILIIFTIVKTSMQY